ncbi:MAG: DUF3782 domain-containing protein [Thermoprotei archaeon]|nr:DUF3782 domain-containing protein [Thermoprotei archaeon]
MQSNLKEAVRKVFLELLEDREFRYAVAGATGLLEILGRLDKHEEMMVKLIGEIAKLREDMNKLREDTTMWLKRHDEEIARLREDMNKLREDMNLGFKRHDEELVKLREDMMRGFARHDEEFIKLREDTNSMFRKFSEELINLRRDMNRGFAALERKINALGVRWGVMSEEAFRAGMRGIVEEELGLKVERWIARDDEGVVYGYPSIVEIDIIVRDGKVILVEIKSSVDREDVAAFKRKAEFYERKTGVKPAKLMIITPYVHEEAKEAAAHHDIEIYSV